jgi:WD40 repeat protein
LVLSAALDDDARLWDVATGEEVRVFNGTRYVGAVAFSPDGRHILTSGVNGSAWVGGYARPCGSPMIYGATSVVQEWDIETGEGTRRFTGQNLVNAAANHDFDFRDGLTMSIRFSPDGRYMLLAGSAGVALWDYLTGEAKHNFNEATTGYAELSPDGRLVLASLALDSQYQNEVRLWDVETGQPVRVFTGSIGGSANFSPDGRWIVVASSESGVVLYDTDYRDFIATACTTVTRDFTPEERIQYGISDAAPTCPQFGDGYELEQGMTPVPMQALPVWTPLPTMEGTES